MPTREEIHELGLPKTPVEQRLVAMAALAGIVIRLQTDTPGALDASFYWFRRLPDGARGDGGMFSMARAAARGLHELGVISVQEEQDFLRGPGLCDDPNAVKRTPYLTPHGAQE